MKTNGAPPSSEEGKRSAAAAPDPEVTAKATRRRFTAALSVIEKAEQCELGGARGCTARICGVAEGGAGRVAAGAWQDAGGNKKVRRLERENASAGGTPQGARSRSRDPLGLSLGDGKSS